MKVCIIGGGSAGWMSATTFAQLLDSDITLVESPNIPTSSVGESTILQMTNWMKLVEIDQAKMLSRVDGSFKHSIKFTNFLKKDSGSFHYPFGIETTFGPDSWWSRYANEGKSSPNHYAQDINAIALVAERGKCDINAPYSYHFDATKFGLYLKEDYCKDVNHIIAEVCGCEKDENGIKCLELDNGDRVEADLFVDCTGFKSLLLGEYLQEPFIPYDHLIPNDSAWATHVPYEDKENELVAYTECTAIDNGWVWNIPFWTKVGSGYVYSSKHISDEEAKQEFIDHLQSKGYNISECEFKKIAMRVGRYERTFVKNVVAIGMSAGFIEPLESNGLYTVHENLIDLYKTLRRGKPSQFMKDMYNHSISHDFDEFADFVAVHYAFTQREDTQYWRDNFNRSYNVGGIKNIDKYGLAAYSRELYKFSKYMFVDKGFHYIASGMNICAYTDPSTTWREMDSIHENWEELVDEMPTVYECLIEKIFKEN